MNQAKRSMLRRPRAFDDATYVISGDDFSAQPGPSYYNPFFEGSQGFDLTVPFDGQHVPQPYHQDADPYVIEAAWLTAQRDIPTSGKGMRTTMTKLIHASQSRQSDQVEAGSSSSATSSAWTSTVPNQGCADPSTSSTTTSNTTSSGGGTSSSYYTGRSEPGPMYSEASYDSGCRRHIHAHRSLRSLPTKHQEHQMYWGPCVPFVVTALMVAFLVLISLVAMPWTSRMIASVSAGSYFSAHHNPQKAMSPVPGATAQTLVQSKILTKAGSTNLHGVESTNIINARSDPSKTANPTPATKPKVLRLARTQGTWQGKTTKPATVLKTPAGEYDDAEAGKSEEYFLAFPFQYPKRPMCGDVFYTVCQPSSQREFHYRRSGNACVETAADAVHTCNRGANRFASLTHCRQSCTQAGRRPAGECFGKPLFTNCARQDVLSSWWFFEGRKCVPWNFPSGGCPANDSAVFHTAQECRKQCMPGGLGGSPCRPPRTVTCESQHLKYPFFADLSMRDGHMRCLRSSPYVLRGRRCLTGSNRFRTFEACKRTCKETGTT
ncbi:uncharacterized protein [Dermacentor andersoni]|uniref:uncharacterized protein n=1 Tax=Dermacentor andersoni TaxID=34620 RepID=UPI0024177615|nr:uncharacterized protein LOC126524623 [Dermacentor andersoni]